MYVRTCISCAGVHGMDFTSVLEFSESNPQPLAILDVHVLAMQAVVYRPVYTCTLHVPEVCYSQLTFS